MRRKIKLWWIRLSDKILTEKEARELKLQFHDNIYGDLINLINCRSRWLDEKGNFYRVHELIK